MTIWLTRICFSGSSDEGDSGKAAPPAGSADATPRREMSSHATPPVELEVREVVGEDALGIWARQLIPRGTRYGPFLGKWLSEPVDPRFAWEVSTYLRICTLLINKSYLPMKNKINIQLIYLSSKDVIYYKTDLSLKSEPCIRHF